MADPSFCFVLGAGFSCAYCADAPPMLDFLDWAYGKAYYRPTSDHQILNEVVIKHFGSTKNLNIEDLASFLALDLPADFQTTRERRPIAYDQLLDVIVDTLAGANHPRDSKVKDVFERFARYVAENGIPIISFNYDLIFDQLLRNTSKWLPLDGYGVDLPLNLPKRVADATIQSEVPKGRVSSAMLLKLHGSLNWGLRYVPLETSGPMVELCLNGALPHTGGPLVLPIKSTTYAASLGLRAVVQHYWRPFIVAPIVTKAEDLTQNGVLKNLWYAARWALNCATEIHVLGYSLPPTDFEVDALLREGLYGPVGGAPKTVVVANRDATVAVRMAGRYGRATVTIKPSTHSDIVDHLEEFLATH